MVSFAITEFWRSEGGMQNKMKYLVLHVLFLFLGCTILPGCATIVQLHSIDEIPDQVGERTVIVHTVSGHDYAGNNVQVRNDSLHLEEDSTKYSIQIAGKEIKSIETWNHSTGCWEGIALGAVSIGVPIGISFCRDNGNNLEEDPGLQKRVNTFFTVIGVAGGMTAGAIIGGSVGHHFTYVFPEDSLKYVDRNDYSLSKVQKKSGSVYISGNLGGFISPANNYSNTDFSRFSFAPEMGAGVSLIDNLFYVCTKITYFSKSANQWYYDYNYQSRVTSKIIAGTAEYSEWLINAGMQHNIVLTTVSTLGIQYGVTYVSMSEKLKSNNGFGYNNNINEGKYGAYGGFGYERSFEGSPFAVCADAQYNFVSGNSDSEGLNLSIGIKYYFGQNK
jgi:hypothetical protein